MKKSLKNLLIVGLIISSNGLVGSKKPGKITEAQKAAVQAGETDKGNDFTALKRNLPTDPNTNPTRLQQVAAAAKNWWYGSTQKDAK